MRGKDHQQSGMFNCVSTEQRVPKDPRSEFPQHPIDHNSRNGVGLFQRCGRCKPGRKGCSRTNISLSTGR